MTDDPIKVLSDHLEETLDVTKSFAKALQDEMVINAGFRAQVSQEIITLQKSVEGLRDLLIGQGISGEPVIMHLGKIDHLVSQLRKDTDVMQKLIDSFSAEEKERRIRVTDRFINFLIQNSPILLTWIGVVAYFALEYIWKIPLTTGGK